MHLDIKAVRLAAVVFSAAVVSAMLMDTASAVEVTGIVTPTLPQPAAPATTASQPAAAVTPPSEDCFILGSRTFSIPFTVDPVGVQPAEVHLFVKRGQSQDWSLLERKRPQVATRQFQFTAQEDGEYWFAIRTIDSGGRPHPIGAIEPQLKVYVDTTKPQLRLTVDAEADGNVIAKIAVHEATPLKNLQLRYATDTVAQWQQVDLDQMPADGAVRIQPDDDWKQISVQCIVTDTPGNQSVIQQLVKRPRVAAKETHRYASATSEEQPNSSGIKSGLQIQPAPYRGDYANRLRTETVSNPVIQLDRHRNPPPPPPGVTTAHGYASNPIGPDFRGVRIPTPQSSRPSMIAMPTANATPTNSPSLAGIPLPFHPPANLNALPPSPPTPNQTFASQFAQPQTPPADTTSVEEILPPPGQPEEATNELGLRGPKQTADTPAAKPVRPRTAAEAMRPIGEASAADPLQRSRKETQQELIPTPIPDGGVGVASDNGSSSPSGPTQLGPTEKATVDKKTVPSDKVRANRVEPTVDQLELAMQRAPRRYSDSFRFSLAYELEAVGSLGVDAIELYGTVDSGKTWELWGRDPDRASPFDIETKEEGVFGFRIVVVGQNGLASPRPLSGESPDIVVVVDTTMPKVRITGAQYGEGDRVGSLVIRYECDDVHLQKRPVALSFSDSVEGPWTTIAAGLRNDGDYVWPADPQLPRKLYLRIDVTDEAGNVGTYVLEEPIDSQGLAPRARIRGFQTLSGQPAPPAEGQSANRTWSLFQ